MSDSRPYNLAQGNILAGGIPLRDEVAQLCVTSPPYWRLRDYKCDDQIGIEDVCDCLGWATGYACGECYICHMVQAFDQVWRVLTKTGTCWINVGDTYAGSCGGQSRGKPSSFSRSGLMYPSKRLRDSAFVMEARGQTRNSPGLKRKDLCLIPQRLALALQAAGWYVRSDVIWAKTNGMPSSVKDRPAPSHEYFWLLSKSPRYYYDAAAVRQPAADSTMGRYFRGRSDDHKYADGGPGNQSIAKDWPRGWQTGPGSHGLCAREAQSHHNFRRDSDRRGDPLVPGSSASHRSDRADTFPRDTRNLTTVWPLASKGYSEAHFATFPPELVKPPILACSREGDLVIDPFCGSGTTGLVAVAYGRRFFGLDVNPDYIQMADRRIQTAARQQILPLFDRPPRPRQHALELGDGAGDEGNSI